MSVAAPPVPTIGAPRRPGLRREIGFIGLLWASGGSIIGSGWLFGAMWPVAGGTARFPHSAFGGAVGASFGWFSWLQAATVAPIEVMAVIQYSQHYSFAHSWMKISGDQNVLTPTGIVVAVILMGVFTAINFLSVRRLANTNSAATWWKVGVPVLTIVGFVGVFSLAVYFWAMRVALPTHKIETLIDGTVRSTS